VALCAALRVREVFMSLLLGVGFASNSNSNSKKGEIR
jgi:hypothetical protein